MIAIAYLANTAIRKEKAKKSKIEETDSESLRSLRAKARQISEDGDLRSPSSSFRLASRKMKLRRIWNKKCTISAEDKEGQSHSVFLNGGYIREVRRRKKGDGSSVECGGQSGIKKAT